MDIAILQALSGPKSLKFTHIMYKANLNANTLKKKLNILEAKGLIEPNRVQNLRLKAPDRARVLYSLTLDGKGVLQTYRSVSIVLGGSEL
jgi:predicted transcriptional regulator